MIKKLVIWVNIDWHLQCGGEISHLSYEGSLVDVPASVVTIGGGGVGEGVLSEFSASLSPSTSS